MIFALLLFSLMGLRAVSPLAAVYSSMSHRVFLSSARVLCFLCGGLVLLLVLVCLVVLIHVFWLQGVCYVLLFTLLGLCRGRFLGRWSSVLGDVIPLSGMTGR